MLWHGQGTGWKFDISFYFSINPLVPERQDKPFSLQIQQLEVDLQLSCEF